MPNIPSEWIDPAKWKQLAETFGYWQTITAVAATIVGPLWAAIRFAFAPLVRLASKIWSKKKPVKRALHFVSRDGRTDWRVVSRKVSGGQQGTMVNGHWHFTNVSQRDVVLLRARLENYGSETEPEITMVVTKGPDLEAGSPTFSHRNPVRSGHMTEVIANFIFYPPICHDREPLIADVIFTDNYEEEYRIKSVRFPYIGP